MPSKVFTGARAIVSIDGVQVGVFDSCTYAVNIGAEPIHLLGRFGPAEITPTSYEAVTVNCSGFRVIGNGGHVLPKFPKLQDLLSLENVTLSVADRQRQAGDEPIATIIGCVPINYSTGYNAKATSRIQITYLGIKISDESGNQDESQGAINLP